MKFLLPGNPGWPMAFFFYLVKLIFNSQIRKHCLSSSIMEGPEMHQLCQHFLVQDGDAFCCAAQQEPATCPLTLPLTQHFLFPFIEPQHPQNALHQVQKRAHLSLQIKSSVPHWSETLCCAITLQCVVKHSIGCESPVSHQEKEAPELAERNRSLPLQSTLLRLVE